jgi:hypothetical protein
MNVLPSTSSSVAPEARRMNSGAPPTDVKARTGLSTPPGRIWLARAKSFLEVVGFFIRLWRFVVAAPHTHRSRVCRAAS